MYSYRRETTTSLNNKGVESVIDNVLVTGQFEDTSLDNLVTFTTVKDDDVLFCKDEMGAIVLDPRHSSNGFFRDLCKSLLLKLPKTISFYDDSMSEHKKLVAESTRIIEIRTKAFPNTRFLLKHGSTWEELKGDKALRKVVEYMHNIVAERDEEVFSESRSRKRTRFDTADTQARKMAVAGQPTVNYTVRRFNERRSMVDLKANAAKSRKRVLLESAIHARAAPNPPLLGLAHSNALSQASRAIVAALESQQFSDATAANETCALRAAIPATTQLYDQLVPFEADKIVHGPGALNSRPSETRQSPIDYHTSVSTSVAALPISRHVPAGPAYLNLPDEASGKAKLPTAAMQSRHPPATTLQSRRSMAAMDACEESNEVPPLGNAPLHSAFFASSVPLAFVHAKDNYQSGFNTFCMELGLSEFVTENYNGNWSMMAADHAGLVSGARKYWEHRLVEATLLAFCRCQDTISKLPLSLRQELEAVGSLVFSKSLQISSFPKRLRSTTNDVEKLRHFRKMLRPEARLAIPLFDTISVKSSLAYEDIAIKFVLFIARKLERDGNKTPSGRWFRRALPLLKDKNKKENHEFIAISLILDSMRDDSRGKKPSFPHSFVNGESITIRVQENGRTGPSLKLPSKIHHVCLRLLYLYKSVFCFLHWDDPKIGGCFEGWKNLLDSTDRLAESFVVKDLIVKIRATKQLEQCTDEYLSKLNA